MHAPDMNNRHYPARMVLRLPTEMQQAVSVAAQLSYTTPSEYLRRAVLAALRTDGVALAAGKPEAHAR
jgi:hypothetical protein